MVLGNETRVTKSPIFNLPLVLLDDLGILAMPNILYLSLPDPLTTLLHPDLGPKRQSHVDTSPALPRSLASSWVLSMRSAGRRPKSGGRERMSYLLPWLLYCLGAIERMLVFPSPSFIN